MVDVAGYELHEKIGSGGVGDVYRATQLSTGATVAVKVVRRLDDDDATWRRIERELRALVELVGHANVVGVVQMVDTDEGRALVMEHAAGGSLADLVERDGPLPVEATVMIGRQIASAVAAAHERGIVHRDIKPQNVLIDGYGQAKLCDFGIASLLRTAELRDRTSAVSMRYASPEDVEDEGDVVGPPSDVYSLGATLLFLRRGAPPTTIERISGWVPVTNPDQPEAAELDAIIAELLAVSPYSRPTMRVAYERLSDLDRRLKHPADSLLDDDSELFPRVGNDDPDVLFPIDPGRAAAHSRPDGGAGLPAPTVPVSPRRLPSGKRSIQPGPATPGLTRHRLPSSATSASLPTDASHDGPSEDALTAAFGPVVDARATPTSTEANNRFWEDDTIYRSDTPANTVVVDDLSDRDDAEPRRWPRIAALVGVAAVIVTTSIWFLGNRSSDRPTSTAGSATVEPSPVAPPTTAAVPTTTVLVTTAPPATRPTVPPTTAPTTVVATTVPTTEVPTTVAGEVPSVPRPAGLTELDSLPRPAVVAGACVVQVGDALTDIDCDQPHDLQLIASVEADDSGAIAPTDESIRQTAQLLCANRFIELVHGNDGPSALQTVLKTDATAPNVAGWESGDRTIECWVRFPGERLIGSALDSGW